MDEIELKDISFKYKGDQKKVFENLNLSFNKGNFSFVIGSNGSGKSTLLKLLLNANSPNKGFINYFGKTNPSKKHLASLIGYVPQDQSLDNEMWVEDLLDFKASFHLLHGNSLKKNKKTIIEALGIDEILNKRIKQLSGGQRQMINIALGLIHNPDVILLDEPFVGLDYHKSNQILAALNSLGKTIICITHDIDIAEKHANQVIVLKDGVVIENQHPKELVRNNKFILQEIDFNTSVNDVINELSDEVNCVNQYNKLIISYPDNSENAISVNHFIEKNNPNIIGVNTYKNSLKSTIVGLHNISLLNEVRHKKKKKKKK